MPRNLNKSVTVCDSVMDDIPQGRVFVLLIDDNEPTPLTHDALEEFLAKESDSHDIVGEKIIEAALDAPDELDKNKMLLATLDALVADKSPESEAWKAKRVEVSK